MTQEKLSGATDSETQSLLVFLQEQEKIRAQRVPGVRTVLVVLSSIGMVYDTESLRQKILSSYPDSTVFFRTTLGKAIGALAPQQVDLLIDLTGPGVRHQGLFYAKKLRRMARVAAGRNAGLFRRKIYDRVFDEKAEAARLPTEILEKERVVQRNVLSLAGVVLAQGGDLPSDRGQTIALELPPLSKL